MNNDEIKKRSRDPLSKNATVIARLKELIAILETDFEVMRADCSIRLGEPLNMSLDETKWSHVCTVEIEMKSAKGTA